MVMVMVMVMKKMMMVLIISDDDSHVDYSYGVNSGDAEEVDGEAIYPKVNLRSGMLSSFLVNLAFSWEGAFH